MLLLKFPDDELLNVVEPPVFEKLPPKVIEPELDCIVTGSVKVTALMAIAPEPVVKPIVIPEKPSFKVNSSVASRLKVPAPPAMPIVVAALAGSKRIVLVPMMLSAEPLKTILSACIVIAPDPALMEEPELWVNVPVPAWKTTALLLVVTVWLAAIVMLPAAP